MRKSLLPVAGFLLVVVLWAVLWPPARAAEDQDAPVDPASVQDYPRDPTADIEWTGTGDNVAVLEAQFNLARGTENAQLGTAVQPLNIPSQTEWDAKSGGQKALWLINQERTARGVLPLDNVEQNVTAVAQAYAEYLLTNNAWGHSADGGDPWQRLDANPAIAACHDFLNVAENLYVSASTYTSPNRIAVERSIYDWMYEDAGSGWGHRHALLWTPYNDNGGSSGLEGFIGLGHARGAYTFPDDPSQFRWPNTDMIVLNLFDPCATWTYAAPPTHEPTPTATRTVVPPTATSTAVPPSSTPVETPIPPTGKATVSGRARLPTWVTIEDQPFEANTWPGKWTVSDADGAQNGEYFWAIDDCQLDTNSGVTSGMAVGGGTHGNALTACDQSYPNNVRSWMTFGPFSLADAVAAEMRAKVWVDTEEDVDMLCLLASVDMNNFNGPCISGDSSQMGNPSGWVEQLLDLNSVYRTGSLLGRSDVYVALAFITDESITMPYLGAFADNVILRKGVVGTSATGMGGVRITDERGNWTVTDASGAFALANLTRGKHTLTPSKDGYQFYPPTITVDLTGSDVAGVEFVGSTSIHKRLFLPTLLSASRASAASEGYAITDASFQLQCGEGGCTLAGPMSHDDLR